MTKRVLAAATFLNAVTFPCAIGVFFTEALLLPWVSAAWIGAAVLNGLVFLFHYRHAHRNPNLTPAQRDRWEILLFVLSPIAPLVYRRRHMPAASAAG